MANQVEPATAAGAVASAEGAGQEPVPFVSQVPGTPVHFPTFHGRAVSWIAVSLILAGFIAGGFALIFGSIWWLFWTSCGVTVIGGLLGLATGISDDWY